MKRKRGPDPEGRWREPCCTKGAIQDSHSVRRDKQNEREYDDKCSRSYCIGRYPSSLFPSSSAEMTPPRCRLFFFSVVPPSIVTATHHSIREGGRSCDVTGQGCFHQSDTRTALTHCLRCRLCAFVSSSFFWFIKRRLIEGGREKSNKNRWHDCWTTWLGLICSGCFLDVSLRFKVQVRIKVSRILGECKIGFR